MTLYGTTSTPHDQAVANIPSECDSACARYCSGTRPDHCDACRHLCVAATLQCVTSQAAPEEQHCITDTVLVRTYSISNARKEVKNLH